MRILLVALALIVLGVVLMALASKKRNTPPEYTGGKIDKVPEADDWIETKYYRSDLVKDVFIAGLGHHCNISDCGIFGGAIYNEKDNPVDKKAMAIGSYQSKKIIGYVPAAILDDFRKWCGRKNCHCVGYIYRDGGTLRGRVRAYHPDCDNKMLEEDGTQYLEMVCERFGWKIPDVEFQY